MGVPGGSKPPFWGPTNLNKVKKEFSPNPEGEARTDGEYLD